MSTRKSVLFNKTMTHKRRARSKRKGFISQVVLVILLIVVVGLAYYLYRVTQPRTATTSIGVNVPKTEIPAGIVKAPTPYLLLPQGRQIYTIESGAGNEPRGTRIIVDPLDALKGQPQTVFLDAEYDKPIESVNVTLIMDNLSKTYPLSISSGTATKGTWSGTWTIEDDHEKNYAMKFALKYNGKETIINFPIR